MKKRNLLALLASTLIFTSAQAFHLVCPSTLTVNMKTGVYEPDTGVWQFGTIDVEDPPNIIWANIDNAYIINEKGKLPKMICEYIFVGHGTLYFSRERLKSISGSDWVVSPYSKDDKICLYKEGKADMNQCTAEV